MDASKCCPFCTTPLSSCPHLLICMGQPGEVFAGALAERLERLWAIIISHVGDDPVTDAHGVYPRSWRDLIERYATQADLMIEGDGVAAIYVADLGRMEAAVEACIAADEL